MPKYMSGEPDMAQLLIENLMAHAGLIRLIHDGSQEGSKVYKREYRIFIDNKPTAITFKFMYNLRDDWADISISEYKLLDLKFVEKLGGISNARIQLYDTSGSKAVRARDAEAKGIAGSPQPNRVSDGVQAGTRQPT